ncbi:uncharacterized protein ARB_03848 [Trichophyton benhamiae CBS 112371]|uniref:DUF7702 domain-containing protein n=1 Tax=Arthroderma benhamiae (strain ATCC MYA-4681 / CBS 112371) TaxID=663331 RepID=D4B5U1_ARTBC|nr:uncharacterized protein ARB_03848 [Trichophyton benhamiae CBS 112371]EFE29277.1 hypothetical protein ARB_03848 [Trichophyton benhamiae CBS 112371]
MAVDYRHGVAIFSLIVYLPCFFIAVYIALRHGFAKSAGWYFLVVLSLVRVIGSCLELATIANPSEGLIKGAAALNRGRKGIPPIVFRVVGLLVLLGLILSIVGINSQEDGAMSYKPNAKSKAAICVTLGVWVITVGLAFIINGNKHNLPAGEKRLLLAVAISLPFILIRLLYSLISAFSHSRRFSAVSGNVTIYLVMAVLEEMVVVITCLGVGITLQPDGVAAYRGEPASAEEEMKVFQEARDNGYRQSVPAPSTR